nr:uncharacterized protein LOC111771891 [Equus caballus]XP_023490997.1 uncharacterized protein LOC111772253 [Equus caballus]
MLGFKSCEKGPAAWLETLISECPKNRLTTVQLNDLRGRSNSFSVKRIGWTPHARSGTQRGFTGLARTGSHRPGPRRRGPRTRGSRREAADARGEEASRAGGGPEGRGRERSPRGRTAPRVRQVRARPVGRAEGRAVGAPASPHRSRETAPPPAASSRKGHSAARGAPAVPRGPTPAS